jgi:uncharacterized protein (TIRG00374 family)
MSRLTNQRCIGFENIQQGSRRPREIQGMHLVKLLIGGLAFIALTVGIFWYQFSRIKAGYQLPRWSQLQWEYLLLMLLCLPFDTVAAGVRIWLIGRVLQPGICLWTCLKAEWANVGFSMITPSQSGGGFGQIYILNRGGANVGTALSISLLSFLGTMIGLLCIGLYSLIFSSIYLIGPFFYGAVLTLTLTIILMIFGFVCPGFFRVTVALISRAFSRVRSKKHSLNGWWPPHKPRTGQPPELMGSLAAKFVDLVYTYQDDIRRFVRHGKTIFMWVCILSLTFLFSRSLMAFFCMRFLGIHASTLGYVLELQMALIFLIYFAPTPGGSGLAEGVSLSIMAAVVPIGFAPYYHLLWRCSTLYLSAILGLSFTAHTMARDVHMVVLRRKTR